jgi:hypothetical protein
MNIELDATLLNFGTGWIDDPDAVKAIISENNVRQVSELIGPTDTSDRRQITDLTIYLEKVYGERWYLNQGSCGSCVAFGAALACDTLVAIEIVERSMNKPTGRTDPMSIYWGSRVEIGGNRLWGQGSVGAWAAKWLKDYGVLTQAEYPGCDLSTYSAAVCCGPNANRGVPNELESIARQHPVKDYAQCKTFEDLTRAIESGYPVTVASNQGFTRKRDAKGFAKPSGNWGHQMVIVGVRHDIPGALIANSWGAYFTGGPDKLSPACFWTDDTTVSRMLRQGDSFAMSNIQGWPGKRLSAIALNW